MSLRNYKVHREMDEGEFIKALGYALVLCIFFTMVLFYIRQVILKVHIENEVNNLISSRAGLIQINQTLRLERGYLKSFTRIDNEARNRLGLIEPEPEKLIIIKAETLMGKKVNHR